MDRLCGGGALNVALHPDIAGRSDALRYISLCTGGGGARPRPRTGSARRSPGLSGGEGSLRLRAPGRSDASGSPGSGTSMERCPNLQRPAMARKRGWPHWRHPVPATQSCRKAARRRRRTRPVEHGPPHHRPVRRVVRPHRECRRHALQRRRRTGLARPSPIGLCVWGRTVHGVGSRREP